MRLDAIDPRLHRAGAVLADPRLVRRVVKAHRDIVGLQVPHAHCYALPRHDLLRIVSAEELGVAAEQLPEQVVLLARPPPAEVARSQPQDLLGRMWRLVFHGHVHLVLQHAAAAGGLTDSVVRQRIGAIGRVEFDEIRTILRNDELLLPPADEREQYIEFVALYLELKHFAPELVATTFPSLAHHDHVDAIVASDVDAHALLERSCPDGAEPAGTVLIEPPRSGQTTYGPRTERAPSTARPPSPRNAQRLLRAADKAKAKGNDVRSALLRASAATTVDDPAVTEALRQDLRDLSNRLNRALSPRDRLDPELANVQWSSLLWFLVDEAVRTRRLRYSIEARLLYDLQLAAVAHEKPQSAVDLVTWGLSRGRRPVVRSLPATREVRIARRIHTATKKVRLTHLDPPDRKLLAKTLRWAAERADRNVRVALRPELLGVLGAVGLEPRSVPERLAQDKLLEELLDRIVDRGFFSFAHFRDALSRNQLKLDDLAGGREWLSGDALLQADRLLAESLDGVYRPGEFYLRGLQRLSSLPFGTKIGRALFLFLVLPFGAAFVLLEGLKHIAVNPIAGLFGAGPYELLTWPWFLGTTLLLLGLIHLPWLRTGAWKLLSAFGWLLAFLFVRLPRWIINRGLVKRVLRTWVVRVTVRRVLVPLLLTGLVLLLTPLHSLSIEYAVAATVAVFGLLAVFMTSRVGEFGEELVFDWFAPRWRTFSNQVLPGLLRLIAAFFRRVMDRLERGMYRVDELLRFRSGQSRVMMVLKATVGLLWFVVAYVTRLYITLLVEPELNPIKHFPVCTVAHKLMLPLMPAMISGLQAPLSGLGPVISGTFAGVTATLLPSFFGFLAWEFKENWKLYRASRPKQLTPATFGPHGETMGQLMIPGVHSGTLPKLYDRLRRAAQRENEAALARAGQGVQRPAAEGARGRFREDIEQVQLAVRRFVERELIATLTRSPLWSFGAIECAGVHLVSNRVRVELRCPTLGAESCQVAFEEKDGRVLASVPVAGFLTAVPADPPALRLIVENALAGLYQLSGVDVVREQLQWAIGPEAHYDLIAGRLIVWPDRDYRTELSYRLEGSLRWPMMKPKVRGVGTVAPAPPLDRRDLLFAKQPIPWEAWTTAWSATELDAVRRLLRGPSILPEGATPASAPASPARGAPQGPPPELAMLPTPPPAAPSGIPQGSGGLP